MWIYWVTSLLAQGSIHCTMQDRHRLINRLFHLETWGEHVELTWFCKFFSWWEQTHTPVTWEKACAMVNVEGLLTNKRNPQWQSLLEISVVSGALDRSKIRYLLQGKLCSPRTLLICPGNSSSNTVVTVIKPAVLVQMSGGSYSETSELWARVGIFETTHRRRRPSFTYFWITCTRHKNQNFPFLIVVVTGIS